MKLTGSFATAFRIGLAAARANLVPMVMLWALAGVSVGAYYFLAPFREMLEPIAAWHGTWGWRAAFISQAVFCGILPGAFLLAIRSIRPQHPFLTILAQSLWCGTFGICCNELFHLMARSFGDNAHVSTVLVKSAFDQFVWTVAVIAPANAVFFFWVGRDFSLERVKREWPSPFFRRMVLPNLIPNWIVWIPMSLAIFAFPFPLQIHVNGIVCAFWTLMCIQIGKRT